MPLTGRVALVTGGSGAIGGAIARRFTAAGAAVIATYTEADPRAGDARGAIAHWVSLDQRSPQSIENVVAEVASRYGRLDILVNNAAWNIGLPFKDLDGLTPDLWDRVMETNLRGPFLLSRACAVTSLIGTPAPTFELAEPRSVESFSQELRYTSDYDGPFNWVGGLYFFKSDERRDVNVLSSWDEGTYLGAVQSITFCPLQSFADFENGVVTPACVASFPGLFGPNQSFVRERNRTTSYSAYADGNFELFDGFTVLGGLRYTHDKKKFNATVGGDPEFFWNPPTTMDINPATGLPFTGQTVANSANWSKLTYRVGFQYKPTDKIMVYGTRATGFRSGVFDAAQSDPTLVGQPVNPENATSHELGVKSRWLDNRLQVNVALFNVEYTDLQFFFTSGGASLTTNAGKARVRGVEVELTASVTDYLTLSANYSHQDGTSSGIPAAAEIAPGTPPQGTIPNTYMVAADFEYPFSNGNSISAHVDLTHKDRYGLEFNDSPQFNSRTKSLVNANLGYKLSSGWEFSIWGQNLTNENIVIYGNDFWFATYDLASAIANPAIFTQTSQPRYSAPRTYGATIRYSF